MSLIYLARSRFLFLVLCTSCCSAILFLCAEQSCAAAQDDSQKRPNIVLLMVDDLGWTDVGCYGSDLHETPNIDALAQKGIKFTDGYAAASLCSPTRAALMTGKYPARLKMTTWHERSAEGPQQGRDLLPPRSLPNLARSEVTIAEHLREAGYRTAHVGKWHLGTAAYYPETQGFDINVGGTFWGAPSTFHHPFRGPWSDGELRYVPGLGAGKPGDYLTDRLTDAAIQVIEDAADQPFYLNMCYHTVHTPIEGKAEIVAKYKKKVQNGMLHRNPEYAAMVQSLDESVGRILAKLEEQGIAERTVVVFTSDNGGVVNNTRTGIPTTNVPLRSGKGSLYEGGIRVPWIVHWPGVTKPGSSSSQPISTQDLFPTILQIAGAAKQLSKDEVVDGTSLVPLLKKPTAELEREALYWHFPHYYPTTTPVSAIRVGEWKLLEYYESSQTELYNLKNDLSEKRNFAAVMPRRTAKLKKQLRDWLKEVDAGLPVSNRDKRKSR